MSRIVKLFEKKQKNVLNVYCTAGYPELHSTMTVIKALQDFGADLIELGIPYSDPLADGPVIQASGTRALINGMTVKKLFEQLQGLRSSIQIPVLLMGYMNPVLQFGFEQFCAAAADAGVDGIILPDLPVYEFETEYGALTKKYGLDFVFLVTPETPDLRIRRIDSLSSGFLYAVSSSSTTGKDKDMVAQEVYFERLQKMRLSNPVLAGFGIKDKPSFTAACRYTSGAVIGSAYIKAIENSQDIESSTRQFLNSILN
jgi:tryptophan synthase alpha chain